MLVNIHFQKWRLQFFDNYIYMIVIRGLEPKLRKIYKKATTNQ